MIYNDRVAIITEEYEEGQFGEPIYKGKQEKVVPADHSPLTDKQQLGYFGTYNKKAFKLHLQGVYKDIVRIKYKDQEYDVSDVIHHGYSTVLVIE
jgi:hypothetical protein